jgi:hypothetical protein
MCTCPRKLRASAAERAAADRVQVGISISYLIGSEALVKGNHGIFRAGVQLYTRASGHARVPGYIVPTAEIE